MKTSPFLSTKTSPYIDSRSEIPGVSGMSLANLSPKPYGLSRILVTSLITPFAAIVPIVPICATDFSPYLFFT